MCSRIDTLSLALHGHWTRTETLRSQVQPNGMRETARERDRESSFCFIQKRKIEKKRAPDFPLWSVRAMATRTKSVHVRRRRSSKYDRLDICYNKNRVTKQLNRLDIYYKVVFIYLFIYLPCSYSFPLPSAFAGTERITCT